MTVGLFGAFVFLCKNIDLLLSLLIESALVRKEKVSILKKNGQCCHC